MGLSLRGVTRIPHPDRSDLIATLVTAIGTLLGGLLGGQSLNSEFEVSDSRLLQNSRTDPGASVLLVQPVDLRSVSAALRLHILVEVPQRPDAAALPDDAGLVAHVPSCLGDKLLPTSLWMRSSGFHNCYQSC